MTTRTKATFPPPIPEARRWLDGVTFPPGRPLINLSQAAPVDPPPPQMRAAMARAIETPQTHLYGPVLGNDSLRAALAENWARHYGGTVQPGQIAITAGCNQAFAATIAALTTEGDEVILPVPWYFNHKMWLDMSGVTAVPLHTGPDLIPDAAAAETLITDRTRAIALVSPNNPGGVEYPPQTLRAFFDLARKYGLRLILDETYRDFHSQSGAPHDLLAVTDWDQTLIQLYSFSKSYRLTGHRAGAIIADPALLHEMEKFQDTVAICAPQMGQMAAEWGLRNLDQWVAEQRDEILARRRAIAEHFPALQAKGWKLLGLGAYFAYIEHPFADTAAQIAPKLVREAGVLLLPGSMFFPKGDPSGDRHFRVAFANTDAAGIADFTARLAALDWPLAAPKGAA
ncbi:aminotransferase [Tropicibacter oceani]|uniref:aspartate transaminase n=1 Tax=Tropicibacter oceani TaxID=3058420 RepID=A0ABY8QE80_9RHOB|nr:aminotransferase [Tropicibacter oceani]WGW02930.1 aminotransferase [Tropicibacter oceani]